MTKILVTGGAGFVGSNLCAALLKDPNNEVWSLDNYSTGTRDNHIPGVEYIRGSTHQIYKLQYKPDIVYHLGEYSRVEQSFDEFDKVWDYNIRGTKCVLEFVRDNGCKLIYAGSSTKFGDGGSGANSSPYAWSKSSNTQLVQNFSDWYGIDYAITYFYNVYGPREIATGKYATVIAKFLEMHKKGLPLTITSPGTQERNFTHVDDIVDGLIRVGNMGYGDGYGIGNPHAYTILEIARMISNNIIMTPEKKGNRMSAEVHTDKTRHLGWKPTRELEDYIFEVMMKGEK